MIKWKLFGERGHETCNSKCLREMYAAINSGLLYEGYVNNKPKTIGKFKVKDFAREFPAAYNL